VLNIDTTYEEVERPTRYTAQTPDDTTNFTGPSGDECQVCGVALPYSGRGRHRKYCDEHKSGNNPKEQRAKTTGGASKAQWSHFNAVVLMAATYLLARFAAGGTGLFLRCPPHIAPEMLDATTEYLAMTDKEAEPIAALIASKVQPTKFNAKHGRKVIALLELEDVGEALWAYGERIGPALAQRMAKRPPLQAVPTLKKRTEKVQQRKVEPADGLTGPVTNIEAVARLRGSIAGADPSTTGPGRNA
jgi:hypothetical protein